jgi:hypothetical protein
LHNFLHNIEEDVKVIHAYCENEDVDEKVTSFVPDLRSKISRYINFFRIVELYWNMKAFVAQAMLAKDPEFINLGCRLRRWRNIIKYFSLLFCGKSKSRGEAFNCHRTTRQLPLKCTSR